MESVLLLVEIDYSIPGSVSFKQICNWPAPRANQFTITTICPCVCYSKFLTTIPSRTTYETTNQIWEIKYNMSGNRLQTSWTDAFGVFINGH